MNILIVEDNRHMRRLLGELVQAFFPNERVLEAEDGASSRALFESDRPDLVVMDIGLPDANGIELAAEFKIRKPTTEIVICSSLNSLSHQEHAKKIGVNCYIQKHEIQAQLLPAIASILHRHMATTRRV